MGIKKDSGAEREQVESSHFFKDDKKRSDSKSLKLDCNVVVKLNKKHKELLEEHLKNERGLSLSAGIRELIFDYMRERNLI